MYLSVVWACCCFYGVLVFIPACALDVSGAATRPGSVASAAFMFAWATAAVLVPGFTALHGFNWATALIACVVPPAALWLVRHRGGQRPAFNQLVRTLVLEAVTARARTLKVRRVAVFAAGAALLGAALLAASVSTGLRLTAAADFDTLWRTRDLLNGTVSWDPLAALAALTARVAAVDALVAVIAVRMCLILATACAAALVAAQLFRRQTVVAALTAPLAVTAPGMSIDLWAMLLLITVAAGAVLRQMRLHKRDSAAGWCATAALLLASAHVAQCARPGQMWTQATQALPLEHSTAARETMRLAHDGASEDWTLIAPPEQALEVDGHGRFYDLAQFVSRFASHAGRPDFRFDLPGARLYVMVEKQPLDVSRPVFGVRFVDAQPAVYRVQSERNRLERAALRACDDYRRTHSGTALAYDDVALRIYQFEL